MCYVVWEAPRLGALRSALKFSVGKLKKRDLLKGIHERMILKWIVNMMGRRGVDWYGSG
jgi:hypothetical protein